MTKNKHKAKKKLHKKKPHNISELQEQRTGGIHALRGFDYQCIYSFYALFEKLIEPESQLTFEGLEDVDAYRATSTHLAEINHIQLKHSGTRQDASFMTKVLTGFLEIFTTDSSGRKFTLVYDFPVSDGHFAKLIAGDLDASSKTFWQNKIRQICEDNEWVLSEQEIASFLSSLVFEKRLREDLEETIYKHIISDYDISSGNELQYFYALYYYCLEKMREGAQIIKSDVDRRVQDTKDAISKGAKNPSYQWMHLVDFNVIQPVQDDGFFEGKKTEFADIVAGLPVRRRNLEQQVEASIDNNQITVIKSSCGQGKTTLAYQVAYNLQNDYRIYQITACNEPHMVTAIVQFVAARVRVGERLLLIIDNLNQQTEQWDILAQRLYEQVQMQYHLLVTSREDDWFFYAGDQSALRNVEVIGLSLNEVQAEDIYNLLKTQHRVHSSIVSWRQAWEQVDERMLLIEYVYLLTHGEMLSTRVAHQVKTIAEEKDHVKLDLLYKVCIANTYGIELSLERLVAFYRQQHQDIYLAINSIKNEFAITDKEDKVVIGLHPVRSEHVVKELNPCMAKQDALFEMLEIINDNSVSKLYAILPSSVKRDKELYYEKLAQRNHKYSYVYNLHALEGLFSGTVTRYYQENKTTFDETNRRGGLFLFLTEIAPYSSFHRFEFKIETLTSLHEKSPENENIQDLLAMTKNINPFIANQEDYYLYARYLVQFWKGQPYKADICAYGDIVYWMATMDEALALIDASIMSDIWNNVSDWTIEDIANLMFSWFLTDEPSYRAYISEHKDSILGYLLKNTKSLAIWEDKDANSIHIEYILMFDGGKPANEESVSRIENICKTLPIYETYCTQGIRPKIEALTFSPYDESVKHMPIRNIVLRFHKHFNALWSDSIMTQYEFATIAQWAIAWGQLRKQSIRYFSNASRFIEHALTRAKIPKECAANIDRLHENIHNFLIQEVPFPQEKRPFHEPLPMRDEIAEFKRTYFPSLKNIVNQFVSFANRDKKMMNVFVVNLKTAISEMPKMQTLFEKIIESSANTPIDNQQLCEQESLALRRLLTLSEYYATHESNPHFNRFTAMKWKTDTHNKEIKAVQDTLQSSDLKVVIPKRILEEGNLRTLPIVVQKDALTDSQAMGILLYKLSSLSELDIHKVVIAYCNEGSNVLSQYGMYLGQHYIQNAKKAIENDDMSILDGALSQPLPTEIKEEYLVCFDAEFILEKENSEDKSLLVDVLLLLWKYSTQRSYESMCELWRNITTESDDIKEELLNKLSEATQATPNIPEELTEAIYQVDQMGKTLSDKELNDVFSAIVTSSTTR